MASIPSTNSKKIINKRFSKIKRLFSKNRYFVLFQILFYFFLIAFSLSEPLSGIRSYSTRTINTLSLTSIILNWLILLSFIKTAFNFALNQAELECDIEQLHQDHINLEQLSLAYQRNAEAIRNNDELNGTYHHKIYSSVAKDIEQIVKR